MAVFFSVRTKQVELKVVIIITDVYVSGGVGATPLISKLRPKTVFLLLEHESSET